jgi:ABC-type sugar transport system permease subunit
MIVALVLNAQFKGRGIVRAAVLIPNLVSATVCRRHCIIGTAGAPP